MAATIMARLSVETRERLESVRVYERETVDDLVKRLLDERERREEQRRQSRKAS